MPGRAERHKQLIRTLLLECLLSAPANEWQLWFLNLTAKTKNRTSMSTKGSLKCVSFIPSATKLEFCQIQVMPRAKVRVFCLCKKNEHIKTHPMYFGSFCSRKATMSNNLIIREKHSDACYKVKRHEVNMKRNMMENSR